MLCLWLWLWFASSPGTPKTENEPLEEETPNLEWNHHGFRLTIPQSLICFSRFEKFSTQESGENSWIWPCDLLNLSFSEGKHNLLPICSSLSSTHSKFSIASWPPVSLCLGPGLKLNKKKPSPNLGKRQQQKKQKKQQQRHPLQDSNHSNPNHANPVGPADCWTLWTRISLRHHGVTIEWPSYPKVSEISGNLQ